MDITVMCLLQQLIQTVVKIREVNMAMRVDDKHQGSNTVATGCAFLVTETAVMRCTLRSF